LKHGVDCDCLLLYDFPCLLGDDLAQGSFGHSLWVYANKMSENVFRKCLKNKLGIQYSNAFSEKQKQMDNTGFTSE